MKPFDIALALACLVASATVLAGAGCLGLAALAAVLVGSIVGAARAAGPAATAEQDLGPTD